MMKTPYMSSFDTNLKRIMKDTLQDVQMEIQDITNERNGLGDQIHQIYLNGGGSEESASIQYQPSGYESQLVETEELIKAKVAAEGEYTRLVELLSQTALHWMLQRLWFAAEVYDKNDLPLNQIRDIYSQFAVKDSFRPMVARGDPWFNTGGQ